MCPQLRSKVRNERNMIGHIHCPCVARRLHQFILLSTVQYSMYVGIYTYLNKSTGILTKGICDNFQGCKEVLLPRVFENFDNKNMTPDCSLGYLMGVAHRPRCLINLVTNQGCLALWRCRRKDYNPDMTEPDLNLLWKVIGENLRPRPTLPTIPSFPSFPSLPSHLHRAL